MRFVETSVFTRRVAALLLDEDYRTLQVALMLHPEAGRLLGGGAGLRKVRWAARGRRRRGGARLIYYWMKTEQIFYMLFAYDKAVQGDLTPRQLRDLARIVREELG